MKCLKRNQSTFYYQLFKQKTAITSGGYDTGEYTNEYYTPVQASAYITPSKSDSQAEQFGVDVQYDRIIISDNLATILDETTLLYINVVPNQAGTVKPDFRVVRVSKSLNSVAYAISQIKIN